MDNGINAVLACQDESRSRWIDCLRGGALLLVFSRHIKDNFPFDVRTLLGSFDTADLFVALSGYVMGRSAIRRISAGRDTLRPAVKRCATLYGAYLVTALAYDGMRGIAISEERVSMAAVVNYEDRWRYVKDTLLMCRAEHAMLSILPVYLVFAMLFPAFCRIAIRVPTFALAISTNVYIAAQCYPEYIRMPRPWADVWFFNPFAWQFIFVLGAIVSFRPVAVHQFVSRWWVLGFSICLVDWLVVAKALAYSEVIAWTGKRNYEIGRLCHFAPLVLLTACATIQLNWRLTGVVASLLRLCGRHSLLVYCTSLVATGCAEAALQWCDGGLSARCVINCAGWCTCIVVAFVYESCAVWYEGTAAAISGELG